MCSHIQTKVMMKELEKSEIFEVNGGVDQIVRDLMGPSTTRQVIEKVVIPAIKDFASKGAGNRGDAWERYCPKC